MRNNTKNSVLLCPDKPRVQLGDVPQGDTLRMSMAQETQNGLLFAGGMRLRLQQPQGLAILEMLESEPFLY